MMSEKPNRALDPNLWQELREVTPERVVIARGILEEVQRGVDVVKAIRRHPLPEGGYLPKSVLVAAYKALVARASGRPTRASWRASA